MFEILPDVNPDGTHTGQSRLIDDQGQDIVVMARRESHWA